MFKKGNSTTTSLAGSKARQHKHHYVTNSILIVASGLFAAAAALAVVKPAPPPPPVYLAHQTLTLSAPQPASHQYTAPFISETQIRSGDTLAAVLQRLGVQDDKLQPFLANDKGAASIYKLYPGRTVRAALDADGNLVRLSYYHTPGTSQDGRFVSKWLEVTPSGNGGYTATEHSQVASTQIRMGEGEITTSLFAATDAANIPDAITLQMADILASKIDFVQDLRKGDRFRVVYEVYTHNGIQAGTGRVLALEFINGDKTYDAAWFTPAHQSGDYYDFHGKSLKGAFLRTALKFTRISSTFGMRKHPIRGIWTGHQGVDFAAVTGTPIHATADGTVKFIGWQHGYGNVIILKNTDKISTLYAHQSRFAKGLKKGDSVTQGETIGYVGSTGWATGPHLHYEFRINGKPTNPLSASLPVARSLDSKDRPSFEKQVASYKQDILTLARLQDNSIQLAAR